jgi:hypothetical protein
MLQLYACTLQHLELTWKSDNSATFFRQIWGLLRHTNSGPVFINSWQDCKYMCEDNIKTNLKKIGYVGENWINLAQDGNQCWGLVNKTTLVSSPSVKVQVIFLTKPKDYLLVNKDLAPWSQFIFTVWFDVFEIRSIHPLLIPVTPHFAHLSHSSWY